MKNLAVKWKKSEENRERRKGKGSEEDSRINLHERNVFYIASTYTYELMVAAYATISGPCCHDYI